MTNYRKTAIIVGVLYIIGTMAGILSMASSGPVREATYLGSIAANPNQIVIAALFVLLMGLALALVPIMLFPLKTHPALDFHLGFHRYSAASDNRLFVGVQPRRVHDLAGVDDLQLPYSHSRDGDGRLAHHEGLQSGGHFQSSPVN